MPSLFNQVQSPSDMDEYFKHILEECRFWAYKYGQFRAQVSYMQWSLRQLPTGDYGGNFHLFVTPAGTCQVEAIMAELPFLTLEGGVMHSANKVHGLRQLGRYGAMMHHEDEVSPYRWKVRLPQEALLDVKTHLLLSEQTLPEVHKYAYSRNQQRTVSSRSNQLDWR